VLDVPLFALTDKCEFQYTNMASSSKRELGISDISNVLDRNEMIADF
jgi:hypothetical protein